MEKVVLVAATEARWEYLGIQELESRKTGRRRSELRVVSRWDPGKGRCHVRRLVARRRIPTSESHLYPVPKFPFSGDCNKRMLHHRYTQKFSISYHAPNSRTGNRAMIGLSNLTHFPTTLDRFTTQRGLDGFRWSNDPAIVIERYARFPLPLITNHSTG